MARKRNGAVTKRGRYGRDTAKQRREAVAQARKLGASAAAAKLGIPVSTLRSWCRHCPLYPSYSAHDEYTVYLGGRPIITSNIPCYSCTPDYA